MVYVVFCDVEEWRRDLIVFERPRAAVTAWSVPTLQAGI